MEVSSESNIDAGSANEQNASGNENNNNARKLSFVTRLMRETMFIYSTILSIQIYFPFCR